MSLVGILVLLLVFGLIYWAATRLLAAFGIGDPVHTFVIVVLVLLFVLVLLGQFGYGPGLRLI